MGDLQDPWMREPPGAQPICCQCGSTALLGVPVLSECGRLQAPSPTAASYSFKTMWQEANMARSLHGRCLACLSYAGQRSKALLSSFHNCDCCIMQTWSPVVMAALVSKRPLFCASCCCFAAVL